MVAEVKNQKMRKNQNQDDILQHYASPYYDPEKAHKYYMEHRELKPRHSTKHLSDEQKLERSATLAGVRSGVKKAQKADTTKMRDEHKAKIKDLRDRTKSRIRLLSKALKVYVRQTTKQYNAKNEQIKKTSKQNQENISKNAEDANTKIMREANRNIDRLKKQMKSAKSPSEKIALQRQINGLQRKVAMDKSSTAVKKANASANESKDLTSKQAKNNKLKAEDIKKERESVAEQKKRTRDEVTSIIKSARETLNNNLKALRENYKTTLESELENVKSSYDTASGGSAYAEQIKAASANAKKQSEERRKRNNK